MLGRLQPRGNPLHYESKKDSIFLLRVNPIPRVGVHYGPDDHKQPYSLYKIMARATKILGFVPFYIWIVTGKLLLDFFFWKFEKMKNKIWQLWLQRVPPLKKKLEISKNVFCVQKFCFFIFWIYILHMLSFHLRYMTLIYLKFSNLR